MKQRRKHTRILILMITSQILLTLFVMHWLWSQYRSEREQLVKELTGFWLDSSNEVIDTLVYRNYVDPVLSEKKIKVYGNNVKLADVIVPDTTIHMTSGDIKAAPERTGKNIFTVRINHNNDSSGCRADTVKIEGLANDFLIRSVRMIVSHAEDSLSKDNIDFTGFTINPDTTMFKKYFTERISDAGMRFNIAWEMKNDTMEKNDHKQFIHINPVIPFSFPEANVASYKGYLTGRILPQIILGMVLIFITALAFSISYRSIRHETVLNNLRNDFISNITHELKTPVATLSVALESLRTYNMQSDPLVLDEYLRLASQETKRLEELIRRVLDHSLLEANSNILNVNSLDINLLISETAEIMRQRFDKGGSITIIPSFETISVPGDPLFIKGVLFNLLDNSIRYCDREPAITVTTKTEKGFAVIEVNDNGPGIPEEYMNKVFDKFFRLPNENVHNVKGYGLGLSFAAMVIRLHRGTIGVRNTEPGCSFIVKLPLA